MSRGAAVERWGTIGALFGDVNGLFLRWEDRRFGIVSDHANSICAVVLSTAE